MAEEFEPTQRVPSYMLASNTHNTLNNGNGETQSLFDATYDFATKFVPLAVASGASQLYNIIPTVGSWASPLTGYKPEQFDFDKAVAEFDSDLSKYYQEHKLGTDALGFVASSLVPGMAGVKIFNAGQKSLQAAIASGKVGTGPYSKALGLLAPQRDKYIDAATAALRDTGNVFKLTETNTLKALAAGTWQNALEGAAFTAVVNATMYESPVLDERSVGDLTGDILVGAALGGVVGGLISGVTATGAIKRGIAEADTQIAKFGISDVPTGNMSESDKLLFTLNQLEQKTALNPAEMGDLAERAKTLQDSTKSKLQTQVREGFQNLTGGDTVLAQYLNDTTKLGTAKNAADNFLDSHRVSRVSSVTSVETQLSKIRTKLKESGDDLSVLSEEESKLYRNTRVSYLKIRGEDAGKVTDERPITLELADRLGPGERMEVRDAGVQVGKRFFRHENNIHKPFNLMQASSAEVQSRYLWANKQPKWEYDPANLKTVHINDIPLLTKAMNDGLDAIKVMPESGLVNDIYTINGRDSIKSLIERQKADLSSRMVQMETAPQTVEDFVNTASSMLGIQFNLVSRLGKGFADTIEGVVNNKTVQGQVIAMPLSATHRKSLMANISELKRLEGHVIFQGLVDSSGVAAQNLKAMTSNYTTPIMQEVIDLSKARNPTLWKSNKPEQIDRRRNVSELFASAFSYLSSHPDKLKDMPEFNKFAGHLIKPIPQSVLDSVSLRASKLSFTEIASRLDMKESVLRGAHKEGDLFARNSAMKDYQELVKTAGTRPSEQVSSIDELPTYVKILSDASRYQGLDGHVVDAMTNLRAKASLYDEATNRTATQFLGTQTPDIPDALLVGSGEVGPSFTGFTRGDYGTLDSMTSRVGQIVDLKIKEKKTAVSDLLTPQLTKLAGNTDAAIEWSMLNETIRGLPGKFKYAEDAPGIGSRLVNEEGKAIPIKSSIVADLAKSHIKQNGENENWLQLFRSAEGNQFNRDPEVFYPIPRNLKDTPHFAFVVDDTVTGTGHSSMLYAKDGPSLEVLKAKVLKEFPEFKIFNKQESEEYFKAQGKFEWERTINENYINNALARKGISSSPLPKTNPQDIATDMLDWHLGKQASLVREAVSLRYSRQLNLLRAQSESALGDAKSVFGYVSPTAYAENALSTPATSAMKQMLNLQKTDEYPFWSTINKVLDEKVSKVTSDISKLWQKTTHPDQLIEINNSLKKAGYNGPIVDDALFEAMNGKIPRGELTSMVAKANAVLGTVALRADPMHALTNVVGHAVLYGTEARAVIDAIKKGSKEGAGDLAKLANVRVPGTADSIFSHQKIMANSFERLRTQPELKEYYKKHGFITTIMDQYDQTLDHIAIRGTDTAKTFDARVAKVLEGFRGAGQTAEKLTGNKVAEEFNRFLAADFMKQITDVAVNRGIMDEATSLAYINTFVNRTQGNFLASQRPVLFQGPIGQAIGLFQTYQFNLIQQTLRHIGDGNTRNAMAMLGLQGSIFGLNGLPAFNAINTHIVGNAGGNTQHADLYQAIFNGAGKEAGEWLAYGAFSNMLGIFDPSLKTNLYTRGDINPRSLTLVPTDPSKIPIVQATGRFFSNIAEGINQLSNGADMWQTVLRAVEHNGLSRPLAGMAQVLGGFTRESGQVYATNQQGNLLMAHDALSMLSLARMAGAKPMDESMVQEAMYRVNSYRAADTAKRQGLGEAIKTTILGGEGLTDQQINDFAANYVKSGGKQSEFNQFMARQYRNASTTQAEQLRSKLTSPYAIQLQSVMGGAGTDSY